MVFRFSPDLLAPACKDYRTGLFCPKDLRDVCARAGKTQLVC